jgi:MFS family permease
LLKGTLPNKLGINQRTALTGLILVANAFVWYFYAANILEQVIGKIATDSSTNLLLWGIHFTGIGLSALIGAVVSSKMRGRTSFLMSWIMFGAVVSLAPIVLNTYDVLTVAVIAGLWGVSLGLGMPSCMGYFTENTAIEKRGSVAGLVLLLTGVLVVVFGTVIPENISLQTAILSAWRIMGLIVFLPFRKMMDNVNNAENHKALSYRSLFNQRAFVLYLIPWAMFSLITYLTVPLQSEIIGAMQSNNVNVPSVEFLRGIENILTAVCAVVGGLLLDFVGRKRMSIIGFALLGLGYSVLGIYPEMPTSWYFYTAVDGIAWGILFAIFVVTIWGDLSYEAPSDKHYAIGVLPFFISKFLQLTIGKDIASSIPTSAIFSFTAFFLFLAVLPLVYAPETLPEKHIRERELKSYVEKAQKEAAKAQEKEAENAQSENEDAEVEFEVNQEDYEEALKEAEKYY